MAASSRAGAAAGGGRDRMSMWDAPEVFSDGSVHIGGGGGANNPNRPRHARLRPTLAHYPEEWVAQVAKDRHAKRGKIDFNPTSGAVFIEERRRGAPWREVFEQQQELVDEKAAVIQLWMDQGALKPSDPRHLIFSIWSLTQHYADFDVQVRAVLGQEDPFEAAPDYLDTLFTRLLTP